VTFTRKKVMSEKRNEREVTDPFFALVVKKEKGPGSDGIRFLDCATNKEAKDLVPKSGKNFQKKSKEGGETLSRAGTTFKGKKEYWNIRVLPTVGREKRA